MGEKKISVSVQMILVLFVLAQATWAFTKEIPDVV